MAINHSTAPDGIFVGGDMYVAEGFNPASTSDDLLSDGSNFDDVRAELDAYSYITVGIIGTLINFAHSLEDEKTVSSANCGVGEVLKFATKTPAATFTLLEVNNFDFTTKLLGMGSLNVAGTPVVGATQDIVNPSDYDAFIALSYQMFDGSAPSITSIVGTTDGALVLNTDYELIQDGSGVWGIILKSGGAITTLTQTFTVTSDYTPAASELVGYNVEADSVPYNLYKFVSCPDTVNGITRQDTIYIEKAALSSEFTEQYLNLTEEDFTGAEITVTGATGGKYLKARDTL